MFVGYDLGDAMDLHNRVASGGSRTLEVRAYHQASTRPTPAIAGVKLWYSTDDGVTWRPARLPGRSGEYRTRLDIPRLDRTTGAVSLKVEAWDVQGNRIEQMTSRAFALK